MIETFTNGKINTYPELDTGIQYKLNKINRIKDYFVAESHERETVSKALSNYIAAFDHFDNTLLVLSATSASVSIASLATSVSAPSWITSASLSLVFSISDRIALKLLKTMIKKKMKHNKNLLVKRSKLNSKENIVSKAPKKIKLVKKTSQQL